CGRLRDVVLERRGQRRGVRGAGALLRHSPARPRSILGYSEAWLALSVGAGLPACSTSSTRRLSALPCPVFGATGASGPTPSPKTRLEATPCLRTNEATIAAASLRERDTLARRSPEFSVCTTIMSF